MSDLLIRNGRVLDGLGSPAQRADLRITGGTIAEIGESLASRGEREIPSSTACTRTSFPPTPRSRHDS